MLWIILVSYICLGALFAALAQPLIERKVKPNGWYGVRTPKTLSNEDIWYKANEYGGRAMRALGLAMAGVSVLLLPLACWSVDVYALTCTAAFAAGAVWMAVLDFKYIAKL